MCQNPYIRQILLDKNGKKVYGKLEKYSPQRERELFEMENKFVLIPCGKCDFCKKNYRSQWAQRMYCESLYHNSCYFITLTYAIKRRFLVKSDLQKFIKRLRFHFKIKGIKYFACGEYGENNCRSHYHIVIFDLPKLDIEENGNCEVIRKLWNKGIVYVGSGDIGSFDYTAGYTAKKRGNYYLIDRKLRPFCVMSKGIGKQYFNDFYKVMYSWDHIPIPNAKGVENARCCRYFDNLLKNTDIDLYNQIKKNRTMMSDINLIRKLQCNNKQILSVYRHFVKLHEERINKKVYKL